MPVLDAHALEFFSRSAEQTRRIGLRLGGFLQPGDAVCLRGELGAGKTTLVQGLAQGWGALDEVSSPTFVLVNMYRRADQQVLFHLDAYRLDSAKEAEQLDIDSMLSMGPLVVEWPERLGSVLPDERLSIDLGHVSEEQRQMLFRATGHRYDALLNEVRQSVVGAG